MLTVLQILKSWVNELPLHLNGSHEDKINTHQVLCHYLLCLCVEQFSTVLNSFILKYFKIVVVSFNVVKLY